MLCATLAVFMEDDMLRMPPALAAPFLSDTIPASDHMENPIPPGQEPGQPPNSVGS